MSFAPRGAAVS
jgi:hypothetical protein